MNNYSNSWWPQLDCNSANFVKSEFKLKYSPSHIFSRALISTSSKLTILSLLCSNFIDYISLGLQLPLWRSARLWEIIWCQSLQLRQMHTKHRITWITEDNAAAPEIVKKVRTLFVFESLSLLHLCICFEQRLSSVQFSKTSVQAFWNRSASILLNRKQSCSL